MDEKLGTNDISKQWSGRATLTCFTPDWREKRWTHGNSPCGKAVITSTSQTVCLVFNTIFVDLLCFSAFVLEFYFAQWRVTTRCGVINVGSDKFDDKWKDNDMQLGAPIQDLPDAEAVRAKILSSLHPSTNSITTTHSDPDSNAQRVGSFTNYRGYFNPEGGWAEAARAMEILLLRVREMGGRVLENQEVVGLVKNENGCTTGVKCRDGKCFEGDRVILTIGSWTASTFPELELDSKCLATG